MPNEEVDNQELPDALKDIQKELGQDGKADVKANEESKADDALDAEKAPETTTDKDADAVVEFDAQKSIQGLQDELSQTKKNYDELRSKSTRD